MKVELMNKEEIKDFFKITGTSACVCYNTNPKYAEKVGKNCISMGHFSPSRSIYFRFKIEDVSRNLSLQLNRHTVGVNLAQLSQRYVNMNNANFYIPPHVEKDEVMSKKYNELIEKSLETYEFIQKEMLNRGYNKEQANDEARECLLGSCMTGGVWCFTLEALVNFMNKRLCSRAKDDIRLLAKLMKQEIVEILPELEDMLVPSCEYLMWCPEHQSCGRKPNKQSLKERLSGNEKH